MSEDRFEEILERLEALEQRLQSAPAPTRQADASELGDPPDEGDPDEKRRVDLIVGLVTENIDRLLRARIEEIRPVPLDELRLADICAERVRQTINDLLPGALRGGWSGGPRRQEGRNGGDGRHGRGGDGPRDRRPGDKGPDDRGPGPSEGRGRR